MRYRGVGRPRKQRANVQAVVDAKRAKRLAAMDIIKRETPEVGLFPELVDWMPESRWNDPVRLAGLWFLVNLKRGAKPDAETMEGWSVRHGFAPDYLHRLTRRQGFRKAFYSLVLVRDLAMGTQTDQRIHEQAITSDDPRWAIKSSEIGHRAAEELGFVSKGSKQLEEIGATTVKALIDAHFAKIKAELAAVGAAHRAIEAQGVEVTEAG